MNDRNFRWNRKKLQQSCETVDQYPVTLKMKKCFDKKNHLGSLNEVEHYGVSPKLLTWSKTQLQRSVNPDVIRFFLWENSCSFRQGSFPRRRCLMFMLKTLQLCVVFLNISDSWWRNFMFTNPSGMNFAFANIELKQLSCWSNVNKQSFKNRKAQLLCFKHAMILFLYINGRPNSTC